MDLNDLGRVLRRFLDDNKLSITSLYGLATPQIAVNHLTKLGTDAESRMESGTQFRFIQDSIWDM
jgi:hypothetical protein